MRKTILLTTISTFLFSLFLALPAYGLGLQVATITRIEGDVKLFTFPGKKKRGPSPHALFEGEYYSVKPAKVGKKLKRGNVIQTMPGAKARLVYKNGDQITVAPGTAYKIMWDQKTEKDPKFKLMFGKVRGMFKKGGPRTGSKIKTKSAVMGVRGTDFFVVAHGQKGATEISVLRGEVEVKREENDTDSVKIPAGFSAEVKAVKPPPPVKKPEPKATKDGKSVETAKAPAPQSPKLKAPPPLATAIKMRQTNKADLVVIQKHTVVKRAEKKAMKEAPKTEEEKAEVEALKEIEKLEEQAVTTTLEDIKVEDPKLYEEIKKNPKKEMDTDKLATVTVKKLFKKAPEAPKEYKPYSEELEEIGDDAYEKYFDIDD